MTFMEITDVKIFMANQKQQVRAYVSIVLDDCFIIRDLKVIQGDSKLFVAMPSKKMKDGSYKDTVHPLNDATRQKIEVRVLEAYDKGLNRQEAQ
jgi:stage V sporulation protein G